MKNLIINILLIVPMILSGQSQNDSKKILMVVSSYGKDSGEYRPGYEFDEFTQAYLTFAQNDLIIDVASPKGGYVESDKFNQDKEYNKTVLEDSSIMVLLQNTLPTASINPVEYDAIYIVGGKGAMFDLPYDPSLQDIILNLYQREGTILSSVCHGSAAFVNIKEGDKYIIKDEEITGFCNIEEELFGKKWVPEFPFKLEDKLKSRGANFTQADFMLSHVATSGKFITGQNPYSTTRSAEKVVGALGITLAKQPLYKDEKSIYLIQDLLEGSKTFSDAEKELEVDSASFDIELLALWGYYKMLVEQEDLDELSKGVSIVELTNPYFFNENLELALAKNHIVLGNSNRASEILNNLSAKGLLKSQVDQLRKELNNSN